jgi:hypothetical protein
MALRLVPGWRWGCWRGRLVTLARCSRGAVSMAMLGVPWQHVPPVDTTGGFVFPGLTKWRDG